VKPADVVTGGAGVIGRNLVEALNQRGEGDIYLVDSLGRGERGRNLAGLVFEDIWEIDAFRGRVRSGFLPEIATIFLLGVCSATDETTAAYPLDNNYRMTRELCEWSLKEGVRFIYAPST